MGKRAWKLEENQKTQRWYLFIPEGLPEEEYPNIEDIRLAATEANVASRFLMGDHALQKNIHKALEALGEEFSFPVEIERSFDVRLIVTADKLKASLYVRKSRDQNAQLDMKLISSVLTNSKLKNLDNDKIKERITEFRASSDMELDFLLTEGKAPTRGPSREAIADVEWLSEEDKKTLCKSLPKTDCESRLARVQAGKIMYVISPAEKGESGEDVYGKVIPGLPGNDPPLILGENAVLTAAGIKADATGLLLAEEKDGKIRIRVVPYKEGRADVHVSDDKMRVAVTIHPEEGTGKPVSTQDILAKLSELGIKGNIDTTLIEETIKQTRLAKTNQEIIVLSGELPVKAGGYRLQWFKEPGKESDSCQVLAGEKILSVRKFSSGRDGVDVFGNPIKATEATETMAPTHDETVRTETNDNGETTQYFAAVSGELHLNADKLVISDTREISADIDEQTGNVDFPGNVVLYGTVRKGFFVKAAGSLIVSGDAEAALVSANTNVSMSGGIRGAGKGTVWAKQEIKIAFAENAKLLAGADITIDKYCFQCVVKTNSKLIINGSPGVLLGGAIRASRGVETVDLGSPKTVRTTISFGQNYLVSDQIEVCEKESAQIKELVNKINDQMAKVPPTDPRIQDLRKKKLDLLKRNDKLTVRIFTLNEQFETHILSHIRVTGTVYPGVILESHGRYFEVREPRKRVIFTFDQKTGQITCNPLEDTEE